MTAVSDDSQERLFEVEETARPKLVAFGGFVKTELYDVFGDYDLSMLTPEQKRWMTVGRLTAEIFDPPRDAKFVVDGIGLNAHEFNLVARVPTRLAETAMSRTIADNEVTEELLETSERAKVHALHTKQASMTTHLEKLIQRRTDVKELRREARTPGYAHKTEDRMKELLNQAWQEFITILEVTHVHRGWSNNQRAQAEAALIAYLTQGSQRTRVGHWANMLELAENYLAARINILRKRNREVTKILNAAAATKESA